MAKTRIETDSFGPIDVAVDRYWGAQTQRSLAQFPDRRRDACRRPLIRAFGIVKRAAALANVRLGRARAELGRGHRRRRRRR